VESLKPGFVWTIKEFDRDDNLVSQEVIHNLIPIEGLNYMLNSIFKQGVQFGDFYTGLYGSAYTPQPADTMATFPTVSTEVTAYSSATRPAVNLGTVANGNVDNLDDVTEFTGTTDGTTVRGAFISTSPAKGGTTGPLISAVRFPSPRTMNNGSRLEAAVVFQFISV
jgi:hypothetical protein